MVLIPKNESRDRLRAFPGIIEMVALCFQLRINWFEGEDMAAVQGCLPGQTPGFAGLVCGVADVHRGEKATHRSSGDNWKRVQR